MPNLPYLIWYELEKIMKYKQLQSDTVSVSDTVSDLISAVISTLLVFLFRN